METISKIKKYWFPKKKLKVEQDPCNKVNNVRFIFDDLLEARDEKIRQNMFFTSLLVPFFSLSLII